jgi:hypothetical protein
MIQKLNEESLADSLMWNKDFLMSDSFFTGKAICDE